MKPLEEIYGERFFCRRNSLNWRAKYVCAAIQNLFNPKSVIDVGCAIGDLVKEFLEIGIDAYGLEGSPACLPYLEVGQERVFIKDLRLPVDVGRYDLAVCFEVAEHIEPEFADQFVYNLVSLSARILMSAAPPGQGGHGHYNCQPKSYWEKKFLAHGYQRKEEIEKALMVQWEKWRSKPGIKAYYMNLMMYEKMPCGDAN